MTYITNHDSPGNSREMLLSNARKCFPEAQVLESKGELRFPRSRRGNLDNAVKSTTYCSGGEGYINISRSGGIFIF